MVAAAQRNISSLKSWVDQGYDVVIPAPSCSLMVKREYLNLDAGDDAKRVAEHTYDVCEYLMKLKREGGSGDGVYAEAWPGGLSGALSLARSKHRF